MLNLILKEHNMSSEETTCQVIIIDEKQSQDGEIDVDKYHKWSDKSKDVPFKSSQN